MLEVIRRYRWEESYEAAILETDSSRLSARIRAAQVAIDSRIEDMGKDRQGTPEEREAIACALAGIRILKQRIA